MRTGNKKQAVREQCSRSEKITDKTTKHLADRVVEVESQLVTAAVTCAKLTKHNRWLQKDNADLRQKLEALNKFCDGQADFLTKTKDRADMAEGELRNRKLRELAKKCRKEGVRALEVAVYAGEIEDDDCSNSCIDKWDALDDDEDEYYADEDKHYANNDEDDDDEYDEAEDDIVDDYDDGSWDDIDDDWDDNDYADE